MAIEDLIIWLVIGGVAGWLAGQRVQVNAGLRRGMHLPFRPLNNVLRCQIGRKIARHPSPTALEFNCEAVCNDV
jgi:hypothetical protein